MMTARFASRFTAVLLAAAALAPLAPVPAQAQLGKSEGSSFIEAIKGSKGDEVLKFLERGGPTPIDATDGDTGETALHIVVRRADVPYINYLIAKKANLNARNRGGETPLLLAARDGRTEIVTILVKAGANIDLGDSSRKTPLIYAVLKHDTEMVRTLLELGADPDRIDLQKGYSARDYAHEETRAPGIAQLIDAKPKKTSRGLSGPTL